MRRIVGMLAGLSLLLPATVDSGEGLPFAGVFVRDQDARTMELGMLRADLATLRGLRTRTQLWVLVAPSEAAWQRDVSRGLQDALGQAPSAFRSFASLLPQGIGRGGPGIAGAVLSLKMPQKRGTGLIAFHLPPLLNEGRGGNALLNSSAVNQGHFISGVDVPKANDFVEKWMQALYVPGWPSALGKGGAPTVPLRRLPGEGKGSLVLFEGEAVAGEGGSELRERLWDYASADVVPLGPMDTFPRRLESLREMLRSVRVEREALVAREGAYSTLSQGPANWTFETRAVRHPDRYLSLVAPVSAEMNDGGLHSVVLGIFAWYTPLLLTAEEAPMYLDVPAKVFAQAVHRGELPFFRDGEELYFYRGHLERWADKGAIVRGKTWTLEEAREQAKGWAKRFKLRGLDRASQGAIPQRMEPIPEDELEGLVDDRLRARARVDREDLPAWLKHFEPDLKPGKQAPVWALSFSEVAARVPARFSLEGPWQPPVAQKPVETDDRWGARGAGGDVGGGGPVTLRETASSEEGSTVAFAGDLSLEILDLYATESYCRTGGEAGAVVEFEVVGVPEGSVAKLQLEWDLMIDGRSRGMDSWPVERGAGSHEVEFKVGCPAEPTSAELAFVLLDPSNDLMIEATLPIDVRHPGGRSWPALAMPSAKTCAAAAGEGVSDASGFSIGGSVGLDADQIGEGVRGFQRQTLRCSDGRSASGTVVLDITVGCDGRVSDIEVASDQTGDSEFADCVARVMGYAPFDAHDMPDGVSFTVPLRYE